MKEMSIIWETDELYIEKWIYPDETYYLIYPAFESEGQMGVKVTHDELIVMCKGLLITESEE